MPVNLLTEDCICRVRGAMVFWSPSSARLQQGTSQAQAQPRLHGRVQIVDVFSLEVVSGYSRDPQGRLLLQEAMQKPVQRWFRSAPSGYWIWCSASEPAVGGAHLSGLSGDPGADQCWIPALARAPGPQTRPAA